MHVSFLAARITTTVASVVVGLFVMVGVFCGGSLLPNGKSASQLLDLPAAYANNPPGVVTFYGTDYQADTFVWCLDRSGSMAWGNTIDILRIEVNAALNQLTELQQFSIVSFADDVTVFSPTLLAGTNINKALAIDWVNGLVPFGATCLEEAVLQSMDIAESTTGCSPLIITVSDGIPLCTTGSPSADAVLENIVDENTMNLPIVGIFLGTDAAGIAFMESLTNMNPGPFSPPPPSFMRGDANGDGVVQALVDGIYILNAQFDPGTPFPACADSADADDSGFFSGLLDGLCLLNWGFVGSAPPPFPGVVCGFDPTPDALDCGASICP